MSEPSSAPIENGVRRLTTRVFFFMSPAALLLGVYIVRDPFCVLRDHARYYDHNPVVTNRDWVSTTLYERGVRTEKYDAFIFGNSRSLAFRCADWIAPKSELHCFHFDAWYETLFGVWSKIRFIDREGLPLDKALLVLDASVLRFTTDSTGHLLMKHPDTSGAGMLHFQEASLSAFFSDFAFKYLGLRLRADQSAQTGDDLDLFDWEQIPETNDLIFAAYDHAIAKEGDAYWTNRSAIFERPEAPPAADVITIETRQREMLSDIAAIFSKHHTDAQIVIPPLYDRRPMATADVTTLRAIFGPPAVSDFSGTNAFTADTHNYYEKSHFRPPVAQAILRELAAR